MKVDIWIIGKPFDHCLQLFPKALQKNARRIQISCGERSHLTDAITPASANSLFQATQGSREAMSNAEA